MEDSCDTNYFMLESVRFQRMLERLRIGEYDSAFSDGRTEDAEGSVDEHCAAEDGFAA